MSKEYVIGVDIGGTHTDTVLIDSEKKIVKAFKTETRLALEEGVKEGLQHVADGIDKSSVKGIFVGTTHATNAVVENRDLYRVGVIRIAGHHPTTLRPCFTWPEEIKDSVFVDSVTVDGGFECDSRPINPLRPQQVKAAVEKLLAKGVESLAVIGVFSPLCPDDEIACRDIIEEAAGGQFPVSLSHKIGGVGFIERENAAILNAALKKPMEKGFRHLEKVRDELKIPCPLYVTQNDGSIIDIEQAIAFPLLTVSSGPTNSFIGASKLAGVDEALIVDIGGTTSDIGIILNGYPRRSMHNSQIGGITLNFRMPDVMALAIGGGTYVKTNPLAIGPQSCGRNLSREAQIFGGGALTLTDIACLKGCMHIDEGDLNKVKVDALLADTIASEVGGRLNYALQVMRGERKDLPVVIVGGGAGIAAFSKDNGMIIPENAGVANAYGAALAEISATVDTVVSLNERDKALEEIRVKAIDAAVAKGADSATARIVDIQVIPYHYIPNNLARVVVIASGKQR